MLESVSTLQVKCFAFTFRVISSCSTHRRLEHIHGSYLHVHKIVTCTGMAIPSAEAELAARLAIRLLTMLVVAKVERKKRVGDVCMGVGLWSFCRLFLRRMDSQVASRWAQELVRLLLGLLTLTNEAAETADLSVTDSNLNGEKTTDIAKSIAEEWAVSRGSSNSHSTSVEPSRNHSQCC